MDAALAFVGANPWRVPGFAGVMFGVALLSTRRALPSAFLAILLTVAFVGLNVGIADSRPKNIGLQALWPAAILAMLAYGVWRQRLRG